MICTTMSLHLCCEQDKSAVTPINQSLFHIGQGQAAPDVTDGKDWKKKETEAWISCFSLPNSRLSS